MSTKPNCDMLQKGPTNHRNHPEIEHLRRKYVSLL